MARTKPPGISGPMSGGPGAAAARYAGARVHRVEDPRLVTGHGTFVDDVVWPRCLSTRAPCSNDRVSRICHPTRKSATSQLRATMSGRVRRSHSSRR
jgi:hypothetical protein